MKDKIVLPWFSFIYIFFSFNFHIFLLFVCLFLVVLGLHCYTGCSLAAAGGAAL